MSGASGSRMLIPAVFVLGLASGIAVFIAGSAVFPLALSRGNGTPSFSYESIRSGVTTYVSGAGESLCLRDDAGGAIACAPIFQEPGSAQINEGQHIRVADVVVGDGSASVEFFVVIDPPPPAMPASSQGT